MQNKVEPVTVNYQRCKACTICVMNCPAGVLAMEPDPTNVLGARVRILAKESCIGCTRCELSCPDFAIEVADRKEVQFAKLTEESKKRQEQIVSQKFYAEDL